jgi:hypothetical protein
MSLGQAFAQVAPYYNLAMVIVVVILFVSLFRTKNKNVYVKPWYLLFSAICVFIIETAMTILRSLDIIAFPQWIFGITEMIMIALFIYMVLLQEQYIKTGKKG